MSKFDYKKLGELQAALKKQAFVPMDPSMAGGGGGPMPPDAGGGAPPPPDPSMGGGAPMDPSMMGGDPAMGGMPPMDPAMGGMPPMDPSMMGAPADASGLPPPPGGEGEVSPDGEPYMKFTPSQLTKFIKQILAISHSESGGVVQQQAPAPQQQPQSDGSNEKIEEMIAKLDAVLGMQ